MFKKCLTALLTGVLLVTFSLPVFAAPNNDHKLSIAELQKAFPGTEISSIEKAEIIPLTQENKGRLIEITRDKDYVNNLYTKNTVKSDGTFQIASVYYSTYWVQGSNVLSNCKYKQDVVFDDSYSQSRITYVYPESFSITTYGGTYTILDRPQILNYQQSGTNPASSYMKYSLTVSVPFPQTYTCTLTGFVRDTTSWTTFTSK